MNFTDIHYFILIVPACLILMGSLLLICHFAFRAPSYLLWLGLGYIVPSFSVATQSFMSNKQLALSAPILGSMYLFGAWASAYAMGLRKNANARPYWCLALIIMALLSLSYYSYVDDQLWIRMLILNISIALVESLVLFSMFKHYQGIDLLNKIVDFSYLFIVLYTFVRGIIIFLFLRNIEVDMLANSVWWLMMLAASIILSMWFAIVLLGTLVRDIVHQLNDERLRDPLTHLFNRRGFNEAAKRKLHQLSKQSYFLLMCDIDHFKKINDTYGHLVGDQILHQVGEIIGQNVRAHDLVGRFGGEEFIVLLQIDDPTLAYNIANRIRLGIADARLSSKSIAVTASFGLAAVHQPNLKYAIHTADQLLYQAKHSGRNQIGFEPAQSILDVSH